MIKPVVDLTKYQFKHESGDYILYGTWYFGDNEPEPCLVVVPGNARWHIGYKPAVILLSDAYKYDDSDYLLSAAIIFVKSFGEEDTMSRVSKVADLIHGHLQDLIELRPYAGSGYAQVVAEAKMTDTSTGKEYEAELKE